ncbi:ankyrin repeat and SOCS box protein 3-like [Ornithodoros turicata]|uniref:ankyrin repeat and SOCS box protein 3-like n=1 Tax=Ornithodoros turicata TaxID=34597 RepID=UPI003139BCC7
MDFTEGWDDTCSTVGLAARSGNLTELRRLISEGRPVDVQDNRGWRPLHEAAAKGNDVGVVKELLKHESTDVDWVTYEGETALLLACKRLKGNLLTEVISVLLESGADASIADNERDSPLLAACRAKSADAVRLLLTKGGADPNEGDCGGWHPLHEAASQGDLSTLRCLIGQGSAVLDVQDECRMTPVFVASQHGHLECLKCLLGAAEEAGNKSLVDVGAEDGATPLMIAVQNGHLNCMNFLLSRGADPDKRTTDNVTALHLAVQSNALDCLNVLLTRMDVQKFISGCLLTFQKRKRPYPGSPMLSPLHLAVDWGSHGCLQALLDAGFPVDGLLLSADLPAQRLPLGGPPRYETALCYAALKQEIVSMEILLAAGACPNAISSETISPLSAALTSPTGRELKLLLEHGAELNYRREGCVPTNECLLVTIGDYNCLVRALRLGLDLRLCFGSDVDDDTEAASIAPFLNSLFHQGQSQEHCLRVFWVLRVFMQSQPVLQDIASVAFRRAKTAFRSTVDTAAWVSLLNSLEQPLSLACQCRITTRRHLLSIHGNFFESAFLRMKLPSRVHDFLMYSELGLPDVWASG